MRRGGVCAVIHRPDLMLDPAHGLRLDLWRPEGAARGVVLWLHGGGFAKGSRKDPVAARLAAALVPRGLAVAATDYRLGAGPEALAPADAALAERMQRRSRRTGLTLRPRLCGAAFAAALFDAGAALAALRQGRCDPATAGLPLGVAGTSAGGILGLSLAWPPAEWAARLERPDAVLAVAAAMVQPWRLSPDGPPAVMLHGSRDRIIGPENARLAAARARAAGAPLTLVETGIPGHAAQVAALFDAAGPDGLPLRRHLDDFCVRLGGKRCDGP